MKKVVLFFAVCASVALASCGGNNNAANQATDTTADTSAVVDSSANATPAADSSAADSVAKDTSAK